MQRGCMKRNSRKKGPDVWQFRWSETSPDGKRLYHKKIVGTVEQYPDENPARRVVTGLVSAVNTGARPLSPGTMKVAQLCDHFEQRELAKDNSWRSHATKKTYKAYLTRWIRPHWQTYELAEVSCQYASFTDKMLGHGEPIRVREGERVLLRLLNASATDDLRIALPGHQFQVVALDGNPVLTLKTVNILQIGVAERIDAIVEMKQPGVWIFGSISDRERQQGMGVVVEYAGQSGEPQWTVPAKEAWDYGLFGKTQIPADPDGRFELVFRKISGERVRFNKWTINGKSFPDADPLIVQHGKRYRMRFRNESGDTHPLHLHRHSFEITNILGKLTGGVYKDVVLVNSFSTAEVDFVADNPGLTLFHCHAQLHMDFGFMNLIKYA